MSKISLPLQTPTERITHYTLLRKVVCQMGALPPLETPTKKGVRYPSTGHIPPFLVIQPSGCIGWAKVSVGLMWYLYLSETSLSHFDSACRVTFNSPASSSCVIPNCVRRWRICFPVVIFVCSWFKIVSPLWYWFYQWYFAIASNERLHCARRYIIFWNI